MNIDQLIIDFKNNNSMLWVEEDMVRLFIADEFEESDKCVELIKQNKPLIRAHLAFNKIFSREDFQRKTIFSHDCKESILSFAQARLWFIELYEGGTNAYHIPTIIELAEDCSINGIKYALSQIVRRHEILRSTIKHDDENGSGIQVVHETPLVIETINVDTEEDFHSRLRANINRPFDLSNEYPISAKLFQIPVHEGSPSYRTILMINIHHIAGDGWSEAVFQKELQIYYEAYINERPNFSLPPLDIQYKDYAIWQRAYLSGDVLDKHLKYWKSKLAEYQSLTLQTDFSRPAVVNYHGVRKTFALSEELSGKVKALAVRYGVTLNSVLLSSVNILLSKYTGQHDILTGSPNANRNYSQTEGLIGFFVNTLVNRTVLNNSQGFDALLQQVHQEQVEAQQYQELPFEMLVNELGVERDPSRHPIFQVIFSVQGFNSHQSDADISKQHFKPVYAADAYPIETFDLSIVFDDSGQKIAGRIGYATSLFNHHTIDQLISHYQHLLEQLLADPVSPYSEVNLLTTEEYDKIIYKNNIGGKSAVQYKTINQLFEEQVMAVPDAIAVVYRQQRLTYQELNEKSDRLARYIRTKYAEISGAELKSDDLIALYLDRNIEMVVGILAVLKAGGAYVPIDINYPQDRVDYMLDDSGAKLILSQAHLSEAYASLPLEKILQIDFSEEFYNLEERATHSSLNNPSGLAYIIYTSGTTGKPKGVMVEHNQVASFVAGNNFIDYEQVKVVASISNYAFDGSIFDIFFPLCNGKSLAIVNNDYLLDPRKLDEQLQLYNVDTIFVTTALFNTMVQTEFQSLGSLKQLLFGGEICNREIVNKFKKRYQNTSLVHVYGPTENIVYSTYCKLKDYNTDNTVPIGLRLADKYTYILDERLYPVPVGVAGELYIGGPGVARGYFNRSELTAARFVVNPFIVEGDEANGNMRMYKTGDLARWLPDGNIEFLGRNDDQVKIRGYRIELGEIEQVLLTLPGIDQCCVVVKVRKSGINHTNYLVAYYVSTEGIVLPAADEIKVQLSMRMPSYMIPAVLMELPSLPLTLNGKIDKRALPEPDMRSEAVEYVAPKNDKESTLCQLWQEVLGLDRIGITDEFFRLGGNSILAIQLSH
ncbi:MAG: amino acid adenylation domain-containing protein, partial [Mucilaginibacter sp.]|uniref:non-ribosomal peptide synthetase n=1 Tax=Mucilaginibacter sp. TaxID=1882438 RepID=UPI0031B3E8E3